MSQFKGQCFDEDGSAGYFYDLDESDKEIDFGYAEDLIDNNSSEMENTAEEV